MTKTRPSPKPPPAPSETDPHRTRPPAGSPPTEGASKEGWLRIADIGGLDHGQLPTGLSVAVDAVRMSGEPAMVLLRTETASWLTARATSLTNDTGTIVVTIAPSHPAELAPLAFQAYGFTRREQEVVELVLHGAATQSIASALFLSPHTVQDHLKAVFRKAGVSSRRDLVALLAAS